MIGSIELERPYFYCKDCKYGFYPLDEALGLSARKKQHDIQATEAFIAAGRHMKLLQRHLNGALE